MVLRDFVSFCTIKAQENLGGLAISITTTNDVFMHQMRLIHKEDQNTTTTDRVNTRKL